MLSNFTSRQSLSMWKFNNVSRTLHFKKQSLAAQKLHTRTIYRKCTSEHIINVNDFCFMAFLGSDVCCELVVDVISTHKTHWRVKIKMEL